MPRLISAALVLVALLVTSWLTRGYLARDLPALEAWHSPQLDAEFRAREFSDGISFEQYQALETQLTAQLQTRISAPLQRKAPSSNNRYDPRSPAHPDAWPQNWNLSFELTHPKPTGAIVLLHGASDSPYSMRALAQHFAAAGLHVIVPRLPGNGTLPGELLRVRGEDWTAVASMAVKRAEQLAGERPVFIGGYSTGAALALQQVLQALRDDTPSVDGLFLFSPAIGISSFAALAQWDVLLSRVPLFRKFAWMNIWPEYDPFKYASFPKQAGHLVHEISEHNKALVESLKATPNWNKLPPIITFQSVVDETVDVADVLDFYADLTSNGHQLVLFDVNRSSTVEPFLTMDGNDVLERLESSPLLTKDVTLISNIQADSDAVSAQRRCPPGTQCQIEQPLERRWPANVYSLSHIAIPFPPQDPLYGTDNPEAAPSGYNLGKLSPKGERRVLVIPAEDINRLRFNPFFDYMAARAIAFCGVCTGSK